MPAEFGRLVRRAIFACAIATGAAFSQPNNPAAAQVIETAEIAARPISRFKIGSDEIRFGSLEFAGGLEMWSSNPDFGGLSGFRFVEAGTRFMAVADTGFLVSGTIVRDDAGMPAGIGSFRLRSIAELEGRDSVSKWETDAEGMAFKGGRLLIAYERDHRITEYTTGSGDLEAHPVRNLDFLVPVRELRRNRGFETIAVAPPGNAHEGMVVAVTEKSLDRKGNIFAAVIAGEGRGVFTIARHDEFDITDGAFLPGGDLLLLERNFRIATGVKVRLRRIDGSQLKKGRIADGQILLSADMGYQIDNMEGLDVWQRGDGATMVSLVSDDNKSMLQRNLYLEFRLLD